MDTLKRGSKYFWFGLVWFGLVYSCQLTKPKDFSEKYKKKSLSIINPKDYNNIYKNFNDTINTWIDNKLGLYKYLNVSKKYLLDSLLCFNSAKTKFIGCCLTQQLLQEGTSDGIDFFYGVKINQQWFFFRGAFIVIPREMYKQPTNKPLSFEKLHEIALTEVYNGYLLPNGEINNNWFNAYLEGPGICNCKTQAEYDSAYLQAVKNNWADRDPSMALP